MRSEYPWYEISPKWFKEKYFSESKYYRQILENEYLMENISSIGIISIILIRTLLPTIYKTSGNETDIPISKLAEAISELAFKEIYFIANHFLIISDLKSLLPYFVFKIYGKRFPTIYFDTSTNIINIMGYNPFSRKIYIQYKLCFSQNEGENKYYLQSSVGKIDLSSTEGFQSLIELYFDNMLDAPDDFYYALVNFYVLEESESYKKASPKKRIEIVDDLIKSLRRE